jgi:hypothetical protein
MICVPRVMHVYWRMTIAAEFITSTAPSGIFNPRIPQNLQGPIVLKWAHCQEFVLHVAVLFSLGHTRRALTFSSPFAPARCSAGKVTRDKFSIYL